ncbi:MAG: response regulator [Alphaproteobacteria bacterium]|nr:response regulator [Alphaproteobacteria bacterium]
MFAKLAAASLSSASPPKNSSFHEELLDEAFHGVLTPQLVTDISGNAVLANRAFRGWLDIGTLSAEDALSKRFSASPAVSESFNQIKISLQKGHAGVAELPVVRDSKIIEWRRIVARPLEGHPTFSLWRFDDISERRRMEKAMLDEKSALVDFMNNAPVGIYAVDQYGLFRFANKTLAQWLQVKEDELVKGDVHLHDVFKDPPKRIAAHAVSTGASGETQGEAILRRRDGSVFPVYITQTIVVDEDGKGLRTRSVVRDLSPEIEWQYALSESEKRFQKLFDEAPIGVVLIDDQYRIMECNNSFCAITRRKRDSLTGIEIVDIISEESKKEFKHTLSLVLHNNEYVKPIEVKVLWSNEVTAQFFVKKFAFSKQEEDGPREQTALMIYVIDSTEQKQLQLQYTQSQKMQAIGQLAGGVAHDFNNILTAMLGFCDLLLQRHKPGDQSFNDITQIKQNGNRAATLIRQLLAFSRKQTLQPKVLSVSDALSDLGSMIRRLIGAQIRLDTIHGRDVGLIKVDQGQLEQVIVNMVVNARDAMPNGGVVTIKTRNHHQETSIMRGQDSMPAGDYVVIEVIDLGTGIKPENMQRIFDPFFTTKEIGAGTGLGLATVYGIIRQTGGFINVESVIDKGTTFTVYLPLYKPEEHPDNGTSDIEQNNKPESDLTGAGTILLVEDEDAVRVFSTRALKNKGYNVLEARSGEEALQVLEEHGKAVDLVVSDVVMPQMDGPTLYKAIRQKAIKTKFIFVSGYTEDRLREQFSSNEVIYFLPKPFSLKQLASKVKEIMEMDS